MFRGNHRLNSPPGDRPILPPACLGPFRPDPDWFSKYWLEDKPSSGRALSIGRAITRVVGFARAMAIAGGAGLFRRIRNTSSLIAPHSNSRTRLRRAAMGVHKPQS